MTKTMVVCKTSMEDALCVGGLTLDKSERIRLLTSTGDNQPQDTSFEVGDVWDCELVPKRNTRKPHTEDMLASPKRKLWAIPNGREFLIEQLDLKPSRKRTLFDGLLDYTKAGSGFISERKGVPEYAHAFWRPRYGLRKRMDRGKTYYVYEGPSSRKFRLKYVGLEIPVERLHPGSVLHLSLARWWKQPRVNEWRCFLMLSGWFL